MPFIAIVYVDDHTADAIVAGEINVGGWGKGNRFVGLFRYPAKADIGHKPNCKSMAWSRATGGWMRCAGCHQRNPKIRRFLIGALFDFLGANHIPNPPDAFRTPEGYGS